MLKKRKISTTLLVCLGTIYTLNALSIKEFGAKGDGKTNDTEALTKASAWLNKNKSGTIEFPKGIYLVGKQIFDGGRKQSAYNATTLFLLEKCKRVALIGKGATIKFVDGLRFGAFDPVSGKAIANTRDYAERAEIGNVVELHDCENVTIDGLTMDGNCDNITRGGFWYETGYEGTHCGIAAYDSYDITISKCNIHHFALDGIYIINKTTNGFDSRKSNIKILNTLSEYNCRQGLSWCGGIGLYAHKSGFNHTGQAKWASAPAHGLDIEPEGGSVIAEGHFEACTFNNNKGLGFCTQRLKDAKKFTFNNCTVWANDYYAVMIGAPQTTISNSKIYGHSVLYKSAEQAQDGLVISNTLFSDEPFAKNKKMFGDLLLVSENNPYITIKDCTFKTISLIPILIRNNPDMPIGEQSKLINNKFYITQGTDNMPFLLILKGTQMKKNHFFTKDNNKKPILEYNNNQENQLNGKTLPK